MRTTDWAERRREFLDERRRSSRDRYDAIIAPGFDQEWGRISPSHASCIDHLLGLTRVQGTVLDAACGTGKYWSSVLGSGRTLVGLDQSSGMLDVARTKHPEVPCGSVALQHIAFDAVFDAVICVDALENVGPEEWPTVVGALAAAARPGAPLYLTVELADAAHLVQVYEEARARGHPVVPGEDFDGVGYHFHPSRAQVLPWLAGTGLEVLEELEGDEYWHLILRRRR